MFQSDQLYINEMKMDISPVIVRYRHHRYININLDMRSGRIKVREAGYRLGEGDGKNLLLFCFGERINEKRTSFT